MSFAPAAAATDPPFNGADTLPFLSRMRSRPGRRSVKMMLPLGRNARLHGTSRLLMSVVTLNGGVARYGARVCSGNAGVLSGFSVGRESIGLPACLTTHGICAASDTGSARLNRSPKYLFMRSPSISSHYMMAVVLTGRRLFAFAIFLSATLLFMVQPLAAKILLPVLGGSPAVWSTCLVFFQAVLLIGYLYAHGLSTRVPIRWQRAVHLGVLILAGITLAMPMDIGEPGDAAPRWWLLRALASSVGLPFFALSATAPLLQQWFSRTSDPNAKDPYFLYAASNGGSLIGLLGYLLVEPVATRSVQVTGWAVGFWIVAALIAACAYAGGVGNVGRVGRVGNVSRVGRARTKNPEPEPSTQNPEPRTRVLWVVLALVPSALLL